MNAEKPSKAVIKAWIAYMEAHTIKGSTCESMSKTAFLAGWNAYKTAALETIAVMATPTPYSVKYTCPHCGSDEVQHAMWVGLNTGVVYEPFGTWCNGDNSYCAKCHLHPELKETNMTASRVQKIVNDGYKQISRKYRHVARLPPGKTGLEALMEVEPELAMGFLHNANRMAEDQYLRCHDKADRLELTVEEFDEYLLFTGRKLRHG